VKILLLAAAIALASPAAAEYPYPLDPKQSHEAQDIWKGLQDGKQHGQGLMDRFVWRLDHGSDASTYITFEDARRFTQGCSVARIEQEAPESLAYTLNCNGLRKYLYFAASDGSIFIVDVVNQPPGQVVAVPSPLDQNH